MTASGRIARLAGPSGTAAETGKSGRSARPFRNSAGTKFICPMKLRGYDPTQIEQSDHDLWIIDARLTFTKYFASDVPFAPLNEIWT